MTASGALLVQVSHWDPEMWAARLRETLADRDIFTELTHQSRKAARYALVWKPDPGMLATLPELEVIFSLGAGVDHILCDSSLPDRPIVRVVDPNLTMRMTEWVVFQVLLHHRQHLAYCEQQMARTWRELSQPMAGEVTVGIMGYGHLGRHAGQALRQIGFRVIGWGRSPKAGVDVPYYAGAEGRGEFLARTDILVSLLPDTPETRGILNRELIAGLTGDGPLEGPILINAGRGACQIDSDINDALESGQLRAATLDVFETEPLPAESPLWERPNLVLTPHVAAMSDPVALSRYVAGQILRFEAGEALQNLVDREAGY